MDTIVKRIAALLSVKSLVTLVLTGVFAWMAANGAISQDFMTVYTVVIAFYFGTQSQKVQDIMDQMSTTTTADTATVVEATTTDETEVSDDGDE